MESKLTGIDVNTARTNPDRRPNAEGRRSSYGIRMTGTLKEGRAEVEMTIEDLVLRAQAGSMPCFAELVRRFDARVLAFLKRWPISQPDAEDLCQEAFVRAWQKIDQYNPKWAFSTWLFTIARRLAASHIRTVMRRPTPGALPDVPVREDPAVELDRGELMDRVWEIAEDALSPAQRQALWLRYGEDKPIKDVARVLGKTPIAVRVLLHRARVALAQQLGDPGVEDQGLTDPVAGGAS